MNLGPTSPNQAQNEFGSLVFREISYSDSLQKFLTLSRGKTTKKLFGSQIWDKRAKIRPEIRGFFATFSSFFH